MWESEVLRYHAADYFVRDSDRAGTTEDGCGTAVTPLRYRSTPWTSSPTETPPLRLRGRDGHVWRLRAYQFGLQEVEDVGDWRISTPFHPLLFVFGSLVPDIAPRPASQFDMARFDFGASLPRE